jgi:hypothetical protein
METEYLSETYIRPHGVTVQILFFIRVLLQKLLRGLNTDMWYVDPFLDNEGDINKYITADTK